MATGLRSAESARKYLADPETGKPLVGRSTWYNAIKRGEIPHVRIGKRIFVADKVLQQLMDGELVEFCREAEQQEGAGHAE